MATNNVSSCTDDANPLAFTILWSPLPPITWLIPFIGHMVSYHVCFANDSGVYIVTVYHTQSSTYTQYLIYNAHYATGNCKFARNRK